MTQQQPTDSDWFDIVGSLKGKTRRGWVKRNLPGDSIAEHCFGADFVSWMLAQDTECDLGRVLELSVIHELVMAVIPDATPDNDEYLSKAETEESAVPRLIRRLPEPQKARFQELWNEFRDQSTLASRLAREAAKLDTLLQAERYEIETGRTDVLPGFLATYSSLFRTEAGLQCLQGVIERRNLRLAQSAKGGREDG